MPPKPFKPPRPAKTKSASTTDTARKSTTPKLKTNGISKSKKQGKKEKKGGDAPRISAANRLSFAGLPSLSPETGDELDFEMDANGAGHLNPNRNGRNGNNGVSRGYSSSSDENGDAQSLSSSHSTKPKPKPTKKPPPTTETEVQEEAQPAIPIDLLNVLLHQFYKLDNTRMSKGANKAVGRYMETFVREALARVAYEKRGTGTMEVEDLEKVGPQLLLDF